MDTGTVYVKSPTDNPGDALARRYDDYDAALACANDLGPGTQIRDYATGRLLSTTN